MPSNPGLGLKAVIGQAKFVDESVPDMVCSGPVGAMPVTGPSVVPDSNPDLNSRVCAEIAGVSKLAKTNTESVAYFSEKYFI